jgi:hypothetical protein
MEEMGKLVEDWMKSGKLVGTDLAHAMGVDKVDVRFGTA